jgi:serine-type D-Ala-D-Ala carboxypeptidase
MAASSADFAALRLIVDGAVRDGIVPGAVVLCARNGTTEFREAFGARQLEPVRLPASADTIYDVASLTKAVSTSVLAMRLVAAGRIALDDRVDRYLPEFQGDLKDRVTVRHLLCHASGLPPHRPFYESVAAGIARPDHAIATAAAEEPLINRPGAVSVYSDLGFILLGWLMARATGEELDVLFRRLIFEPLGLSSATFLSVDGGRDGGSREEFVARHEVAPTESCPRRGRILLGEVHDLNAFAMGGVAGHAGLFSDAADLGRIARALTFAWHGDVGENGVVHRDVIREFWRPADIAGSTWRLGWDGPSASGSQAGSKMSRAAVGHLGFTGCSIWIDPRRALWIVLLTNRVHPTVREDPRFRGFRAAVHDAALDALGVREISD